MNEPKDLQRGEPTGRNWQTINQLSATVRRLEAHVNKLQSTVQDLRLQPKFRQSDDDHEPVWLP